MQDGEIQRELPKEARSAKKALDLAINIEMGIQKQLKISGTAAHSTSNQAANMSISSIQNLWSRARSSTNNTVQPAICPNFGYGWSTSHRHNCPTRGKNCKNSRISNHFAKVCRKTKLQLKPKPRVNNVDDTTFEAATISTSPTVGEQVDQTKTIIQRHSIFDAN